MNKILNIVRMLQVFVFILLPFALVSVSRDADIL